MLVYGQDQAGAWDEWFGTQNTSYHLFVLPGDMLVCADGQGVNVRSGPSTSASLVVLLKDLSKVRAESFLFTQPADAKGLGGQGWYRISSPQAGWTRADFLSDAGLGNCDFRNQLVKSN